MSITGPFGATVGYWELSCNETVLSGAFAEIKPAESPGGATSKFLDWEQFQDADSLPLFIG